MCVCACVMCVRMGFLRVEMIPVLSEDVNKAIIVRLTLGQADGSGIKILLKQSLKFSLSVVLVKTLHLQCVCVGSGQ